MLPFVYTLPVAAGFVMRRVAQSKYCGTVYTTLKCVYDLIGDMQP